MRVWERGSGETMGLRHRRLRGGRGWLWRTATATRMTDITVKLLGGDLVIRYTERCGVPDRQCGVDL